MENETTNTNTYPTWMSDESLSDIPREKLEFLQTLYEQSQGKNQKELLAVLLPLLKSAKEKNLTLTPKEISLSIEAIKKHSSDEELTKINEIMNRKQTSNKKPHP